MTSDAPTEAYVWIWLPNATEPVVAGKLEQDGADLVFAYGKSYLARNDAIPIYEPELPLKAGTLPLPNGLNAPNCIRDGAPDAWGQRVIINRVMGLKGQAANEVELSLLTYLMESGSDRIGALDFQASPIDYVPRQSQAASLEELMSSAERVEKGVPLSKELGLALLHGSAIGGARPKALIDDIEVKYIAKFSASNDTYSVVKGEYIAMRLAAIAGLNVAPVKLTQAAGKDVLLIKRFDRVDTMEGWKRRAMVSALTLFELDEMMARYASYEKLAEIIRLRFTDPKQTLREMFGRLVFNILCGNTDDHARNHAAFWDGKSLSLTPAYDICPQGRAGGEASQAMSIIEGQNLSKLMTCIDVAHHFQLDEQDAHEVIMHQRQIIQENWDEICGEAKLSPVDRDYFWKRQFLNPFAFEGLN
ncbi:MAG: phosphatidylinositol kinase [Kordiimonas sp.]|nr:phosphatidylinositol kinase [Kordiimonas sp.]|tara:strand:+ start:1357 stop:2610 length:1254 start_codon:yes stop_codon:yes gene_type:complete